ncbi:type II secretion system protein [Chromobacterium vaccinii]|uniref:type II secretion system protein n=1 Tax=Chromobacterium vaccinii TaxID=1108595 RepID=UPI003C752522
MSKHQRQNGFTIIELLAVVVVLGILATIFGPTIGQMFGLSTRSRIQEANVTNRMIADSLIEYARTQTATASLPAPYTGNGYTSTVYNPAETTNSMGATLTSLFNQAGLNTNAINDDGSAGQRVRVYQRVPSLTLDTPLYFNTGDKVTLTYDVGVVYSTDCNKVDGACMTAGIPGNSAVLTSGNVSTWSPSQYDYGAQIFSTLPLQKSMLATTADRLNKIRDAILNNTRDKQRIAAADLTVNFMPQPTTIRNNAAPVQGCWEGWYNLSLANETILNQIGLNPATDGVTAWGKQIEFCRDYDAGSGVANTVPHYGALRIGKDVANSGPSTTVQSSNLFLTF